MTATNQKKQAFVICVSAAVVCVLAVAGGFYARSLEAVIKEQVKVKRQEIAAAEAKIVKIPSIEKQVVMLRENLGEYVKILPDTKELNEFVRMLNQFERQSGAQSSRLQQKSSGKKGKGDRFRLIEYSYEMTATLWEMMRFINLVENYERFVNISDFNILVGNAGSGRVSKSDTMRDGDEVHNIRLTMQTYQYDRKASAKEVEIPDYEKLRDTLREEIFKRMQAIRMEKYEHRGQQGRRDIFVDPRFRGDVGVDGLSPSEQRAILERYVSEADQLRAMLQRVRQKETTLFEQYALEKGLRTGILGMQTKMESDAVKITYAPYRVRWVKEVENVLEGLQGELDRGSEKSRGYDDPYLPMGEMEELVAEMKRECENGYLEEARQRYELVEPQAVVPEDDERYPLSVEAKTLHTKAVTALDFRAMDLRIQGVIVDRSGRSGVLLNGDVYEEGEYVSEELLVKLVEEEQVWFVFRGLTLVRTM